MSQTWPWHDLDSIALTRTFLGCMKVMIVHIRHPAENVLLHTDWLPGDQSVSSKSFASDKALSASNQQAICFCMEVLISHNRCAAYDKLLEWCKARSCTMPSDSFIKHVPRLLSQHTVYILPAPSSKVYQKKGKTKWLIEHLSWG